MQRRKATNYNGSGNGNGAASNHFTSSMPSPSPSPSPSSSSTSGKNVNRYALPTIKSKQQRKRSYNLVQRLVQIIMLLLVATSITMLYIGFTKSTPAASSSSVSTTDTHGGNHADTDTVGITDLSKLHDEQEEEEEGTDIYSKSEKSNQGDEGSEGKEGDDMLSNQQHQQQQQKQKQQPLPSKKKTNKRTTIEANEYMKHQSSKSVDGEKYTKQQLVPLYIQQQQSKTDHNSPIVTRYIGKTNKDGNEMKYWVPKSTTSDEGLDTWERTVNLMTDERRKEELHDYPFLNGIVDHTTILQDMRRKKLTKKTMPPTTTNTNTDEINPNDKPTNTNEYPIPSPDHTHVILNPTFGGTHRPNVDAIFALAEGYDLKIYVLFIESIKASGFVGDLVLSISDVHSLKPGVEEYIRSNVLSSSSSSGSSNGSINVVAYAVSWKCYNNQGEITNGSDEGVHKCEHIGLYGEDADEHIITDPREARPVATARFELYWLWNQYYEKDNWIMLIDSRDAYFQSNPFDTLVRGLDGNEEGLLYFFAENAEETTIGKSKWNSNWLKQAYGLNKVQSFFNKPIICSGSTMGQQVAMEQYLRAMIAQFDTTGCILKGCDQGFHNYLHYSNSLPNLDGIQRVDVFEQGKGLINNLGLLRSKSLSERGLLDDKLHVLNWDGSVSAVAHQFDRDDELNNHMKGVRREYVNQVRSKESKAIDGSSVVVSDNNTDNANANTKAIVEDKDDTGFASPAPKGTHVILKPTFGKHRPHVDAIFGLAEGYDLRIYLLFIESLKATGFNGDLVLSVSAIGSLQKGVEDYLRSNHKEQDEDGLNVVVYTVTWDCYDGHGDKANGANEGLRNCELVGMYGNDSDNAVVKDTREARPVATARFELYWAWSQYYEKHNWIMLIDTRDAHFQLNPFAELNHDKNEDEGKDDGLLYFFAENANETTISKSKFNRRWLKEAYGMDAVKSFMEKPIICSGSTMGQQVAMEPYLRAMVAQFDNTKCKLKGCDQGFHNYLYYTKSLPNLKGVRDLVKFEQGKGIINNLGLLRSKPLRDWGVLDDKNNVLNWDGSISAVAHQFDRDDELNKHLKNVRREYATKFWASKK